MSGFEVGVFVAVGNPRAAAADLVIYCFLCGVAFLFSGWGNQWESVSGSCFSFEFSLNFLKRCCVREFKEAGIGGNA